MKTKLRTLIEKTLQRCFEQGALSPTGLPDYVIEVPNNPEHGHYATNLPLALASSQRRSPLEIAGIILDHLLDEEGLLEGAETAGPGFINFTINRAVWYRLLSHVLSVKHDYGRSPTGGNQKVLVEYVSANPTGPLHLGHGRGAALGDTLSRILAFCGYDVTREFYINDAGQQVRLLGESIFSRWNQLLDPQYPFPERGYHGDYALDLARTVSKVHGLGAMPSEEAIETCAQKGKAIMLEEIKRDLERFRVTFDRWYSETELYDSGLLNKTLKAVEKKGHLYEADGALWIRTSDFGDDKDRVIRKKDGEFTYFASDIAYHLDKKRRGFEKAINVWGADHHGYVPRIQAALSAYGFPEGWLSVMLIQLVKLWKNGQEIKMSKRAGSYVTLQELMDEVGVDAVRFVFLTKNHDSTLDFDIDLAKKQDSDNPVYYVQYAHARICSIFRKAAQEGISLNEGPHDLLGHLVLEEELGLIRHMAEFPALLVDICRTLEPHRLTYYLTDLAAAFHKYFNLGTRNPNCRIVTRDKDLSRARLSLAEAVRRVLANGLALLGISAPEKM